MSFLLRDKVQAEISRGKKALLMWHLADHLNDIKGDPNYGECFPTIKTLAKEIECGRSTIKRLIHQLKEDNWIAIEPRKNPRTQEWKQHHYYLKKYATCEHGVWSNGVQTWTEKNGIAQRVKGGRSIMNPPYVPNEPRGRSKVNPGVGPSRASNPLNPNPQNSNPLTGESAISPLKNTPLSVTARNGDVERGDGEEEQEHRQTDTPRSSDENEPWRKKAVQSLLRRYDTNANLRHGLTPEEEPFPQSPYSSHHTSAAQAPPVDVRAFLAHHLRYNPHSVPREALVRWLKARTTKELTAFVNDRDGADEVMCEFLDLARSFLKRRQPVANHVFSATGSVAVK